MTPNSSHSSLPLLAVLGAAALDWVARVQELPGRDGIVSAEEYTPNPGGTGGNVAVAAARLGIRVSFLGVLGGDEAGQILLTDFLQAGVDVSTTRIEAASRSAACFIAVDRRGERTIISLGGVALYTRPDELDPAWLHGVRVLFIADAYAEVAQAAMQALEPGAQVVFAPGGLMAAAGLDYLQPILRRADVLIASRSEARTLTGQEDPGAALRALSALGPPVVLETVGTEGAWVLEAGQPVHVPALPVAQVVDTTGAGDAFTGGVLAAHLEGHSWTEAARWGCAAAALKIGARGARGGLPDRARLQACLEQFPLQAR